MLHVVDAIINLKDIFFSNEFQSVSLSPFHNQQLVRSRLIVFQHRMILDVTESVLGQNYTFAELLRFYSEVRKFRKCIQYPSAYNDNLPQLRSKRKSKSKLLRDRKRAQEHRSKKQEDLKQLPCLHVESPESTLNENLSQDPITVTPLSDQIDTCSSRALIAEKKIYHEIPTADAEQHECNTCRPSPKDLGNRHLPAKWMNKYLQDDRMRRLLKLENKQELIDFGRCKLKPKVVPIKFRMNN